MRRDLALRWTGGRFARLRNACDQDDQIASLAANFPDDLRGDEGEPLSLEDATRMIREQWGLGEFVAPPKATDEPDAE